MKLKLAYLCLNQVEVDPEFYCHEVFERAPAGRCPSCGSEAIVPVGSLLWTISSHRPATLVALARKTQGRADPL